jgi:hypothetical protein
VIDARAEERARIRALVVLRMNYFHQMEQEYRDYGDERGAHAWSLVQLSMRGLLEEIDHGDVAANKLRKARR